MGSGWCGERGVALGTQSREQSQGSTPSGRGEQSLAPLGQTNMSCGAVLPGDL